MQMNEPVTQIEIDQRVFDLYDEYCHGRIDRREFLLRAAAITAGGLAMAQLRKYESSRAKALPGSRGRVCAQVVPCTES